MVANKLCADLLSSQKVDGTVFQHLSNLHGVDETAGHSLPPCETCLKIPALSQVCHHPCQISSWLLVVVSTFLSRKICLVCNPCCEKVRPKSNKSNKIFILSQIHCNIILAPPRIPYTPQIVHKACRRGRLMAVTPINEDCEKVNPKFSDQSLVVGNEVGKLIIECQGPYTGAIMSGGLAYNKGDCNKNEQTDTTKQEQDAVVMIENMVTRGEWELAWQI